MSIGKSILKYGLHTSQEIVYAHNPCKRRLQPIKQYKDIVIQVDYIALCETYVQYYRLNTSSGHYIPKK